MKRKAKVWTVSGKNKGEKIAKVLGASKSVSTAMLVSQQMTEIASLKRELAEHKRLFEKQHDRTHHADILWREANGKPDTSPDLGTLLQWLIDRGDRWQALVIAAKDMDSNFNGPRYTPAGCVCGHMSMAHENDEKGTCRNCDCEQYREEEMSGDERRWKDLRRAIERLDAFYEGYKF